MIRKLLPTLLLLVACSAACGGGVATPPAASAQSAAPSVSNSAPKASVAALGDKKKPFTSTTALDIVEAAKTAGVPLRGESKADKSVCAKYKGCRSAATVGDVEVIVFESATAAQAYRDTAAGAEIEKAGGRRYWSLVKYLPLDADTRSAWRDLQREIIPS